MVIKKLSKTIFFSLLPLIACLVLLELGVRAVYFQNRSGSSSGLALLIDNLSRFYSQRISLNARAAIQAHERFSSDLTIFARPEGEALLRELKSKYEEKFASLLKEVRGTSARFLLMYLPSQETRHELRFQNFFRALAEKNQIEFLDLSEALKQYPLEKVTLLPEDPHLSRFGNQLVAEALAERLKSILPDRPVNQEGKQIPLYGDLKPNNSTVWELAKPLPFVASSNSQGLRNLKEFLYPKTKRRILCLGDSFTFGLYVPLVHSFPYLLEQAIPDVEVANAGVSGYTIEDQASLFRERAKYLAPDLVILQVYDNDITDQLWFLRRVFARNQNGREPSPAEQNAFH